MMNARISRVRLPLVVKVLPLYAIIIALFVVPYVTTEQRAAAVKAEAVQLSRQVSVVSEKPVDIVAEKPKRILVPSIGISLNVVDGSIDNTTNKWSVADGVANFALTTPTPSTKNGRPFIYGHWTQDVFGKLPQMQIGDKVYVETIDNHVFEYIYVSSKVVEPTDMSVLEDTKSGKGLILMTCTGFRATERYVQYYNLESVK